MDKATDPVCGMTVERKNAPVEVHHEGEVYYFCSQNCAKLFLDDPKAFTDSSGTEEPQRKE